jgi:hypothetical protein
MTREADRQVPVGNIKECNVDQIERALFAIEGVRDCIVRARNDARGCVRIVAYVAASPALARAALDSVLQAGHVAPAAVDLVHLNSLPLDPNGVPDEAALEAIPVIDANATARLQELVKESWGEADFEVTRDWSASAIEPMSPATRSAGSDGTPAALGNSPPSGTATVSALAATRAIASGPPIN